jgi:hypothetical protein
MILSFVEKAPEEKGTFDSLIKSDKLMKTPKPLKGEDTFEEGTIFKKTALLTQKNVKSLLIPNLRAKELNNNEFIGIMKQNEDTI